MSAARGLLGPLGDWEPREAVTALGGLLLAALWAYHGAPSALPAAWTPADSRAAAWAGRAWQNGSALLLLGLLPLAWARWGQGLSWRELGLGLGDWRLGLRALGLGALLLPLLLAGVGASADFRAEYPLVPIASAGDFLHWELLYAVYYAGWELLFRGSWQLGLRRLGPLAALLYQTGVSTALHLGKPEGEFLAAIAGGLVFGLLALRSRSVLYPFLLHWLVGAGTDLSCLLHGGRP